jgi:uncharacterized membrane protein YfcA
MSTLSFPPKSPVVNSISQLPLSFPVHLHADAIKALFIAGSEEDVDLLTGLLQQIPAANILVVGGIDPDDLTTQYPQLQIDQRKHDETDFEGRNVVFVATGNAKADYYIQRQAEEKGLFVYNSSDISSSTFYFKPKEFLPGIISEEKKSFAGGIDFNPKRIVSWSMGVFAVMLIGHFIFSYIPLNSIAVSIRDFAGTLDRQFPIMLAAGFFAQLVDGALGMGYGVTSATILLSAGVNPAAISGSIHTAELFASGASGYSHYKFGNVNKKLFKALLIPGIIGAVFGAVLLVQLGNKSSNYIKPVLATYTLLLGARILFNAFRNQRIQKKFKRYGLLAAAGGFLDSFGGGGWGPIVTTTLITKGRSPKYVIGSVSLSEFFVTLSSAFTFFIFLGVTHWQTIAGLIIGGLIAAPIAAKLAGKLPRKTSFILLGILVILWSGKILWSVFF